MKVINRMCKNRHLTRSVLIAILSMSTSVTCLADTKPHPTAIQTNAFANALVKLSDHLIKNRAVISEVSFGGYGGITNDLKFYREVKNINKINHQIISIVRWERRSPNKLHDIVVNIYDSQGRLKRDYSASYLPVYRLAPYQTLINLHYYRENLHSFRQFDALDDILYEQCVGRYDNKNVSIGFEYDEMPDTPDDIKDKDIRQAYLACFNQAATSASPYTDPLIEIKK